jgi:hypothetical protein
MATCLPCFAWPSLFLQYSSKCLGLKSKIKGGKNMSAELKQNLKELNLKLEQLKGYL